MPLLPVATPHPTPPLLQGFIPELQLPEMGIWGFILGSAVIGMSQARFRAWTCEAESRKTASARAKCCHNFVDTCGRSSGHKGAAVPGCGLPVAKYFVQPWQNLFCIFPALPNRPSCTQLSQHRWRDSALPFFYICPRPYLALPVSFCPAPPCRTP